MKQKHKAEAEVPLKSMALGQLVSEMAEDVTTTYTSQVFAKNVKGSNLEVLFKDFLSQFSKRVYKGGKEK